MRRSSVAGSSAPMTGRGGLRNRSIACPSRRFSGLYAIPNLSDGLASRMIAAIRSQVPTGTWAVTYRTTPSDRCGAISPAVARTSERSLSSRSSTGVSNISRTYGRPATDPATSTLKRSRPDARPAAISSSSPGS
jgi:hypothetical protein